jgi:hypothetical protein
MTAIPSTEIWEAVEARSSAEGYLREANGLSVESVEDMASAAELREQIRRAEKDAEQARETLKRPALEEGRRIDSAFGASKKLFTDALAIVDRSIRSYRRREEERAVAEEMRRRAEAEKERIRLMKLAQKAEAKGLTETADRLEQEAEMVPVPSVESRAVKPEGFIPRKVWKFEIVTPADVPDQFKTIDETAIRRVVQALGAGHGIAGVRAWQEEEYSSRGTR